MKETVVHTLLNEQPQYPQRMMGQVPYGGMEAHEAQGMYRPYPDDTQKLTLLKREQIAMEEPYPTEGDAEGKDKATKGFSHLVNYLG